MSRAAGELRFEVAQRYKQRLDALDHYAGKSVIVSARIVDVDVFSLLPDDDVAWCNFVRIRHGSVVGVQTVKLSTGIEDDERDMLTLAIQYMVENVAGGRTGPGGDRSVSAVDDAAVRRRDLHGAQAGGETSICWSFRARVPGSTGPSS